jgi:hypothetical protein
MILHDHRRHGLVLLVPLGIACVLSREFLDLALDVYADLCK